MAGEDRSMNGQGPGILVRGSIRLDPEKREVVCRGHPAMLTRREYEVLRALMEVDGRIIDAPSLQEAAFGAENQARTPQVPTIIARLRRRLGDPRLIETIVGEGYRVASARELAR
jgi:two-component system response regulator VanR